MYLVSSSVGAVLTWLIKIYSELSAEHKEDINKDKGITQCEPVSLFYGPKKKQRFKGTLFYFSLQSMIYMNQSLVQTIGPSKQTELLWHHNGTAWNCQNVVVTAM